MQVSHDNTKLVKHKVIEFADREKFHRQRKSQAHFVPYCFGHINIGYGLRLLGQES